MLECEGYKMFRGKGTIVPVNDREPYTITGTWLYKPEWGCWYVGGRSFPAEIVEDIEEEVD